MPDPTGQDDKKVLALLWHAPHGTITAGGFRRTYEILARTPEDFEIHVVDDTPSFLRGIENMRVSMAEYGIPAVVRRLEDSFFWVERVLEWTAATVAMMTVCARLRLKGERFDVIFVPSSEQIPALVAGILARYVFRVPLVACNLNIDIFPAPLRRPLARLHNLSDVVIAISEHLAGTLEGYGVKVPIELNQVGLDTTFISGIPEPERKKYDAIFVGRHDTEKGVFDLVQIWAKVVKRRPGASLLMIGSSNPTNRARLDSLIEKLGLRDNVKRLGMVNDRRKFESIKGSRICLFPSYVEEWGIVPQEALACGLPVVAYDLPVYRENIKGCPSVFLERTGDLDAMAWTTCGLLEGDAYLEHAGTGPEFVKRFDWDAVARREFDILRSASSSRPREGRRRPATGLQMNELTVKKVLDSPPRWVKDQLQKAAIALIKTYRSGWTFEFDGREYKYFYHPYNLAWRNERAVEVPIAIGLLEAHRGGSVLEVGNVLSHYIETDHDVVDKYEVAPGVINADAVGFDGGKKYDLIISISTLEHIGWDETPRDPDKPRATIQNLINLLAADGELMATVPLGQNPGLDCLLAGADNPFSRTRALKRARWTNAWKQVPTAEAWGVHYSRRSFRARAVIVGSIGRGG